MYNSPIMPKEHFKGEIEREEEQRAAIIELWGAQLRS